MFLELLRNSFDQFKNAVFVVVGDYCLDVELCVDCHTQIGDRGDRFSIPVSDKLYAAGGAGNVARHLLSLGAKVFCVGLLGNDSDAHEICNHLSEYNAVTAGLTRWEDRKTDSFLRIQNPDGLSRDTIYRSDLEYELSNRTMTTAKQETQISYYLDDIISEVDGVVIVDMHLDEQSGTLTHAVKEALSCLAKNKAELPFLVDSRYYLTHYRYMYLKCNMPEFVYNIGLPDNQSVCHPTKAAKLLSDTSARGIFVTDGANGIYYYTEQSSPIISPGISTERVDTCGAGDASTCGILMGLNAGLAITDILCLGNLIGSYAVRQVGTGTLCRDKIEGLYGKIPDLSKT